MRVAVESQTEKVSPSLTHFSLRLVPERELAQIQSKPSIAGETLRASNAVTNLPRIVGQRQRRRKRDIVELSQSDSFF
jgi:hypothetical protein